MTARMHKPLQSLTADYWQAHTVISFLVELAHDESDAKQAGKGLRHLLHVRLQLLQLLAMVDCHHLRHCIVAHSCSNMTVLLDLL